MLFGLLAQRPTVGAEIAKIRCNPLWTRIFWEFRVDGALLGVWV